MDQERTISPIGYMQSDFAEKFGVPRQSGRAPDVRGKVVLLPPYDDEDALKGIEGFSHLWLLFDFSLAKGKAYTPTVRPPRLGGNTRVGVFASRSPFRPNRIGLSCVKLLGVERQPQLALLVSGADLVDGTPIFDVKPYLPFTDCVPDATGGYATAGENYKLDVEFPSALAAKIPKEKLDGLVECLADDPRPSYQNDPLRTYGMSFGGFEIKFRVEENKLIVTDVV